MCRYVGDDNGGKKQQRGWALSFMRGQDSEWNINANISRRTARKAVSLSALWACVCARTSEGADLTVNGVVYLFIDPTSGVCGGLTPTPAFVLTALNISCVPIVSERKSTQLYLLHSISLDIIKHSPVLFASCFSNNVARKFVHN